MKHNFKPHDTLIKDSQFQLLFFGDTKKSLEPLYKPKL